MSLAALARWARTNGHTLLSTSNQLAAWKKDSSVIPELVRKFSAQVEHERAALVVETPEPAVAVESSDPE